MLARQRPLHGIPERVLRFRQAVLNPGTRPVHVGRVRFGIPARGRETEVHQLHHRLQVLGPAAPAQAFAQFTYVRPRPNAFACQLLGELELREVAETALEDHGCRGGCGNEVLVGNKRMTAGPEGQKPDLVFLELRRLDEDAHPVRQRPDRDAQSGNRVTLDNRALLRFLRQQWLRGYLVYIRLYLLLLHAVEHHTDLRLVGNLNAFLFRTAHKHHPVIRAKQLGCAFGRFRQRNPGENVLTQLDFSFDAGLDIVEQEALRVCPGIPCRLGSEPFFESTLQPLHVFRLRSFEF